MIAKRDGRSHNVRIGRKYVRGERGSAGVRRRHGEHASVRKGGWAERNKKDGNEW